jgi:hypothetical protein
VQPALFPYHHCFAARPWAVLPALVSCVLVRAFGIAIADLLVRVVEYLVCPTVFDCLFNACHMKQYKYSAYKTSAKSEFYVSETLMGVSEHAQEP